MCACSPCSVGKPLGAPNRAYFSSNVAAYNHGKATPLKMQTTVVAQVYEQPVWQPAGRPPSYCNGGQFEPANHRLRGLILWAKMDTTI